MSGPNSGFARSLELDSEIELIITETESIFLSFSRDYPRLLREMDSSLRTTMRTLDCFSTSVRQGCSDDDALKLTVTQALDASDELLHSSVESLFAMEKNDTALFARLAESINSLAGLDRHIRRIKEDSIEMEIISLNAMTVALKAGASGRAFSFITEELKRLSTRIISLTDEVNENGSLITRKFSELQTELAELREFQNEKIRTIEAELKSRFQELRAGVQSTAEVLRRLLDAAAEIQKPLKATMTHVQVQDIIRQSLEQITYSMNQLKNHQTKANPTTAEKLDDLSFFEGIPRLCVTVVEEVHAQILAVHADIDANFVVAHEKLTELADERSKIIASYLEPNSTNPSNLHMLFARTSATLGQMIRQLKSILSKKRQLGQMTLGLLEGIQELNSNFASFKSLINRFQTIDVASRIEVSKNDVLSQMNATVDAMNRLTATIGSDVEASSILTGDFLTNSRETIYEVRELFEDEDSLVTRIEARFKTNLGHLEAARSDLDGMIRNFSVYGAAFFSLFSDSQNTFNRLLDLDSHLVSLRSRLEEMADSASAELQMALKANGLASWTIVDQKMQRIIERFTIFGHKKAAGVIGGFEIDEGVEAGNVTLF